MIIMVAVGEVCLPSKPSWELLDSYLAAYPTYVLPLANLPLRASGYS